MAVGAWGAARSAFISAAGLDARADALEGLGIAARYLLDADAAFAAHEEGYRTARIADDPDTAARFAVQLSYDAYAFRGPAEAVGWVERAAMLVEGRPATMATAFVPFVHAYMALLARHDPEQAQGGAAEAAAVARAVGAIDLEMLSVALEGLALVASGAIPAGMAKLDAAAAAAVGGESRARSWAGTAGVASSSAPPTPARSGPAPCSSRGRPRGSVWARRSRRHGG